MSYEILSTEKINDPLLCRDIYLMTYPFLHELSSQEYKIIYDKFIERLIECEKCIGIKNVVNSLTKNDFNQKKQKDRKHRPFGYHERPKIFKFNHTYSLCNIKLDEEFKKFKTQLYCMINTNYIQINMIFKNPLILLCSASSFGSMIYKEALKYYNDDMYDMMYEMMSDSVLAIGEGFNNNDRTLLCTGYILARSRGDKKWNLFYSVNDNGTCFSDVNKISELNRSDQYNPDFRETIIKKYCHLYNIK